jgi:hypothetical protein
MPVDPPSSVLVTVYFIRDQLREGAVVLAREMYERAEQQDIAKRTLEQAKKTLGVRTDPKSGPKAAWSLPEEEAAEPADPGVAADPDYEADEAVNDTAA